MMHDDDDDNDSDDDDSDDENNDCFILTFYLKVAICIQNVLYLVVIKSISWNFDYLNLNFLLWKPFQVFTRSD